MPSSAPFQTISAGSDPIALVTGDFTGNGRTDLAVVNGGGVMVLLANGDGTFQPGVEYSVGFDPDAIVTGEFTDDGRIDIAVAGTAPETPGADRTGKRLCAVEQW